MLLTLPHIRWLIGRDIPEVLQIENQTASAWTEDEFHIVLRKRNSVGMVAECNLRIVGFMVYELHEHTLHLLNLAVDEEFRRLGIGSQMITKLVAKLTAQRREQIILAVRETNLAAQLFFRSQGLRATSVMRNYYGDDEHAIAMHYSINGLWNWWDIADGEADVIEGYNGPLPATEAVD